MAPTIDVDIAAIRHARERIAAHARRTPVITSELVDAEARKTVFFKAEMLQVGGAFKFRGATNAVFALDDREAERGVVTHSSGNHGQALALAAKRRGIAATVVLPENAPRPKRLAVEATGAVVEICEPTLVAREAGVARVIARSGARLVHPYDDPFVIAGQGTAALELLEEVPDLDAILVPVGGGGLASGTAIAAHALDPRIRVYGSEPAVADDAARSLQTGVRQPPTGVPTIADGLRTALSERTFAILRAHLEGMATVVEDEILRVTFWLMHALRVVVEPSSAVPVAALLGGSVPGRRIGVILSGGNADLDALAGLRGPLG